MKAILVFDKMPNSCDECEVRCTGYTAKDYAQKGIKRPSWCPIKPMPEKYIEHDITIETERDAAVCSHGITLGHNDVIEELEKPETKSDLSTDEGWWKDYELYEMQND